MAQINLIPPEVIAEINNRKNAKLPDNTLKMLQILASLNTPKELLATLLEIAEFSIHHIRYLAGPLVIYGNSWSDTIPQWLKFACIQDRLELICNEYKQNQIGEYATATEVLTYMMPASYEAPLHRDYADLYLWVGNEVLTKYNKLPKDCQSFYEFIDGNTSDTSNKSMIHFQQVKNDFHDISQSIRRSIVKHAAQEGWGKRRVNSKSKIDSIENTPPPESSSNSSVQMDLF
ncbi:MAG: hypothetical protein HEQ27_12005 [Dolichospermum sp. JUN01]|nr:hypothetical protein [Dolichospermum sp. JUN01]MBS9393994.1 hypothetical protein [Dolichospermum sp. OL01]MCO5797627.1 hypothetical protein [Dolichospermum sp. OL03]MCS6280385.1 hypothetical protein [Dolichospermum sp.]QSV59139.1 MAG: hypothetical protein HEQ29_12880 [Dolichospermum sp. LBC05a]